jgi:hypothetical protein
VDGNGVSPDKINFDSAVNSVENLSWGGFTDWRIPTLAEYLSLEGQQSGLMRFQSGGHWTTEPGIILLENFRIDEQVRYASFNSGQWAVGQITLEQLLFVGAVRDITE